MENRMMRAEPGGREGSASLARVVAVVAAVAALVTAVEAGAQTNGAPPMDAERAAALYVSDLPEDRPYRDYERDVREKAVIDSLYRVASAGVFSFRKVSYPSRVDGMPIPAYVFEPPRLRGPRGHAALVWVHGGVHGNWGIGMLPFVREAVERGYVVIAPEYRGSTGYGKAHHDAIDYGGYEVDDVMTAYDYAVGSLPHVDPERVAVMGWSHGGFIASHAVFREEHPFQAAVAIVPVTNLVFRLSYKGPRYQRYFSTQERIRGLPFERREVYIERSPVYHVDRLRVPILVHLATNDDDVDFVEAEMFVHALRVKKPELAETRIYVDPPGGHSFSRRVDPRTLQRADTPEQRDSWNRTWTFLDWNLRPYEDRSESPIPSGVR
jgi:dipeptidyl aminopeptidase/acylaminoacyl peptidase